MLLLYSTVITVVYCTDTAVQRVFIELLLCILTVTLALEL